MKLFFGETVVKVAFSVADRPLPSSAWATILYLVPRSSSADGFQDEPSAAIEPLTSAPLSACTSFTPVSLPPLTWTPGCRPTFMAPSSAAILILVPDVSLASSPSAPPGQPPPPQADSVSAPAAHSADTPIRRALGRAGTGESGILTRAPHQESTSGCHNGSRRPYAPLLNPLLTYGCLLCRFANSGQSSSNQ